MPEPPKVPRRPTSSFKQGKRPESPSEPGPSESKGKPPVARKPNLNTQVEADMVPSSGDDSKPPLPDGKPKGRYVNVEPGSPPPLVSDSAGRREAPPVPPDDTNVPIFDPNSAGSPIVAYDENMEFRENVLREDGYEKPNQDEEYNTIDEVQSAMYGPNENIKRRSLPPPLPEEDSDGASNLPLIPPSVKKGKPPPPPQEEEEGDYEEVMRPNRPTVQPVIAVGGDSMYETIHEVAAAAANDTPEPPPVVPYNESDDKTIYDDTDPLPNPASPPSSEKKKPGISNRKKKSGWLSAKGKPKGQAAAAPAPSEYAECLDTIDTNATALFEASVNKDPEVKFEGDLIYTRNDKIEIIQIENCPRGKWIGRLDGEIGMIESNNIKVDAEALKAMMMSQGPAKPPTTASPEGIPHTIGQKKSGDATMTKDEEPPKTIIRKPKPDSSAPPPPVESYSGGGDNSVGEYEPMGKGGAKEDDMGGYETMRDVNQPVSEQDTYEVIPESKSKLSKGQSALLGDSTSTRPPTIKKRNNASISEGQRKLMTRSMIDSFQGNEDEEGGSDEMYMNMPSAGAQDADQGITENDYVNVPKGEQIPEEEAEGVYSNIEAINQQGRPEPKDSPDGGDDMYGTMEHN